MSNKENVYKWGYLRETKAMAEGVDPDTGLHRNGLEEYLAVIFPDVDDWVHDKMIKGSGRKFRPDYRSERLKLIVEFDGLPHYQNTDVIFKDLEQTDFYECLGYKVVRIPYFIQLTNEVVKQMFGVDVPEKLFTPDLGSMGIGGRNTPSYISAEGIVRMAYEFTKYPGQYDINIRALKSSPNFWKTGVGLLEMLYKEAVETKPQDLESFLKRF